ncbi:MAG: DoxX family membrane protein [Pseudomonadota bacterium]
MRYEIVAARILLAQLFLLGGVQKVLDPGPAQELLTRFALPAALVWPAFAFNLLVGAALLLGWRLHTAALLAAAYCGVTSLFHLLPSDPWQMTIFVKNWAIAGGCLALAATARAGQG